MTIFEKALARRREHEARLASEDIALASVTRDVDLAAKLIDQAIAHSARAQAC